MGKSSPNILSISCPRSILILTCLSVFTSSTLLVVSMLDLGLLSFFINLCVSIFTVLYNVSMLVLARRRRRPDAPSYFSTCIVCAYILAVLWLVAWSATTMVLVSWVGNYGPQDLHQDGLPVTVETQRLQCFLAGLEFFIVGAIAVRGDLIAKAEGPDPESWRPMHEEEEEK
ncbi:hypothetical protein B0H16DRAFT_1496867 [Mycena metata]|uniref:Uncharacterized protein n=1 Tax=Mycena metata TaxID=1033252 RepID=A0AAD7NYU0_9AGAR|nr:hypothetical protein B0H16DRAFT_1496867 [Mycena metata]